MRPSNVVSGATFFSSAHTASCRPADPAIASAPSPTSQRALRGSATAALLRSLPDPGACSGPTPLTAPAASAGAAAPSSCSTRSSESPVSTAAGAAQIQFLQQRAPEGQLPPPQASNARQCSRSDQRRLIGHAAAEVAVVIFACSIAGSFAQHVAISGSSDIWSTAALSQARYDLAATSLPNAGVAIFAGGDGTLCDVFLRLHGVVYGCEGDA
jgi:hypothetical protein